MINATPEKPAPPCATTPFDDGALDDLIFEWFELGLDFYLRRARAARGLVFDVTCSTSGILLPRMKAQETWRRRISSSRLF